MICSLLACGDDFSRSDFWPIFATKTGRKRVLETGVWLKLWQNPAHISQPFPSPSPFSPFFSPSLLLPHPQWVKNGNFSPPVAEGGGEGKKKRRKRRRKRGKVVKGVSHSPSPELQQNTFSRPISSQKSQKGALNAASSSGSRHHRLTLVLRSVTRGSTCLLI